MADLPADRLEESPPFTHVAADFFGPFLIKERRSELKRWICIFSCLSSRAVHLDVAIALSTDSFINVFRRFVCLRGPIKRLRLANGTNFVGAANEWRAALNEIDVEGIRQYLTKKNCEFVFHPAKGSHMNGAVERPIRTCRSVLVTLLKEFGGQLNDDALRTVVAEVTAIINSRPLAVENLNDPRAPLPICPNQILNLKSEIYLPPPGKFQATDTYHQKYWRRAQYVVNVFWSRWRKEYIQTLQQRQKWTHPQRNMEVGDVVLINDDETVRAQWKLGRLVETNPSPDGRVRKIKVLVGDSRLDRAGRRMHPQSILDRPTHKVVLLVENPKDS